jgi:AAA family ATP:ADP antiporter
VSRTRAELAVAVWGALSFGSVLASFMAFRPVRDALVLDGNPDQIPWLFTTTFIVVSLVTPLWSTVVSRRPRHIVPLVFHAFAVCAIGFFFAIRSQRDAVLVGRVFYVWSAVFNIFAVSVFWSMLADLLGHAAARRLYGPIAAGGTIGAVLGPALTKLLLGDIGVAGVLIVTAVLLELAVLGAVQLSRAARSLDRTRDEDPPLPVKPLDGFAQVVRSPYLAAIAGFVLCTAIAGTLVYLAQADIVKHALPDRQERTQLFATIDLWVNALTFVAQLVISSPLLALVGPGVVLCLLPLAQGIGITALVAAPTLATLIAVQITSRTLTHGLNRPARELLFTVVSRDEKYRAKNAIDLFVFRLGDFGSAWLYRGLVAIGIGGIALAGAAIPLSVVWIALAIALGVGFRRRTLVKESV